MGQPEPETEVGAIPPAGRSEDRPVTTPEPRTGSSSRFQNRRLRLFLAVAGGIMVLLCLGGVGAFVILYDEATEIKRTAPDAVVNSYLAAILSHRDDQEATLYQCRDGGDFAKILEYRADTQRRETEFSVGISMSWYIVGVAINESTATVNADVTRTVANQAGRDGTSWQFTVVDQDGWRVCGARQI